MSKYGCSYGGNVVLFCGDDPWDVIERAVTHYAASGSIDGIKVGRNREHGPDDTWRFPLPIAWIEGEWVFGYSSEEEEASVITYAIEPSPETGHVGWCWWALGKMGDAPTLKEAMEAAEKVIEVWL